MFSFTAFLAVFSSHFYLSSAPCVIHLTSLAICVLFQEFILLFEHHCDPPVPALWGATQLTLTRCHYWRISNFWRSYVTLVFLLLVNWILCIWGYSFAWYFIIIFGQINCFSWNICSGKRKAGCSKSPRVTRGQEMPWLLSSSPLEECLFLVLGHFGEKSGSLWYSSNSTVCPWHTCLSISFSLCLEFCFSAW